VVALQLHNSSRVFSLFLFTGSDTRLRVQPAFFTNNLKAVCSTPNVGRMARQDKGMNVFAVLAFHCAGTMHFPSYL
jgi:hypothetical protein